MGAKVITAGRGRFVDLPRLMRVLAGQFGIQRLLVEGGGTVHRSMIAAGLYDELHLIICPFVLGGSNSISPVERKAFWPHSTIPRYRLDSARVLGDYLYVIYKTMEQEKDNG